MLYIYINISIYYKHVCINVINVYVDDMLGGLSVVVKLCDTVTLGTADTGASLISPHLQPSHTYTYIYKYVQSPFNSYIHITYTYIYLCIQPKSHCRNQCFCYLQNDF